METAFTLSFREPSDTYPMEYSSPETVVNITSVLFVMIASSVVLSIFSPASFFSSTPNSSMNAPLVPEPSSRDTTLMYSLLSKSPVAADAEFAAVVSGVTSAD